MEAYRVFSETICTELEDTMQGPGAPPTPAAVCTGFTPGKASGNQQNMDTSGKKASEYQRNMESKRCGVAEVRPWVTEKRRSAAAAAGRAAVGERADVERNGGDENGSGTNTFLTALKQSEGVQLGLTQEDRKSNRSESVELGLTKEVGHITANDSSDCQGVEGGGDRDAVYDAQGKTSGSHSSLARQRGKRKIDIILAAASREFGSTGIDVDAVARTGRGRRGRGRRPAVNPFDMQRFTLRSAR